ncbi:hypothetical protein ACLKA6_008119 [Drosophila palustris]
MLTKSKQHFDQKYGIPGIVGCIDGTHIKTMKPGSAEQVYFNRKGYFSINAMVDYPNNPCSNKGPANSLCGSKDQASNPGGHQELYRSTNMLRYD